MIVEVQFLHSKVFPAGAVVQASVEEVRFGVIGDTEPDYWQPTPSTPRG